MDQRNGLDTVVRIPNNDWTSETNIITEYGKAKASLITPWLLQLQTSGVQHPTSGPLPICSYDITNLSFLGDKLLNSLKPAFKSDVIQSVGVDADGLTIFQSIIQKCVLLNA